MADFAFFLQVAKQAELFVGGDLRIDAVQLEQVDAIDAQPAQAHLAFLPQVLRPADGMPLFGPGAHQARLGGDDQPRG